MSIDREIRYITTGTKDSVSQVFYNNYLADSTPGQTSFFSFYKPQYFTYGGTLSYYSQDPYSIFTNLVRPPIRFVFSANTSSLSGDSYFVHEIYRLDYDTYRLFSDNQISDSPNITNRRSLDTANSGSITSANPISDSNKREFVSSNKLSLGNNAIPTPEKFFGEPLTENDFNTIQNYFVDPLLVVTASTSAITGYIYDLFLDQYVKQFGKYKTELFLDKAQYFINTKIVFNVNLDKDYSSFFNNNSTNIGVATPWDNVLTITATNNFPHEINNGPFSGITVAGNYFSYFIVPDKPLLEYPIMTGTLTTFTPEFRWSNGDNADSFLIQISYNTGDTGFTGTIYNYPIEKSEKNSHISTSRIKDAISEFTSEKTIFTAQIPIKSNTSFIYRVGNSKELIDVFNIRRNIITFTDYFSAITQPQPIRTYVVTESDSTMVSGVSGLEVPPSLDFESEISSYILSGTVSGSTVTGATMQLIYPNSSFATLTTSLTGTYAFSGLSVGTYTLITNYRGYQQDSRAINITGNTSESFKIKLLWGNQYDTWGAMAGDNYFI